MSRGFVRSAYAGFSTLVAVIPLAWTTESAADEAAAPALEEIVVTAQKRVEASQKASVALDVVKSSDLTSQGIRNAIDIQDIVPTVRYVAADQMTVLIRGLGTINDNPGVDSAVGYSEDGVYLTHPSALTPVLFDMQRVEVLLGPQGTLYGRNTNAGVLSFVTNDPATDKLSGHVRLGGGDYSAFNSEGAVNLPFNEHWALRLAAASEKHSGYNEDGTNNLNSWAARGKLLYTPNEDWSFKLTLNGAERRSFGQSYGGMCPPGNVVPGCAGVPWRPWSGFSPSPAGEINNYSTYGASFDANGNLGWATLTSITSYRGYDLDSTTAPASGPGGTANFLYHHPDHDTAYTEELRLGSPAHSAIPWVLGVFYSHELEAAAEQYLYNNSILQAFFGAPPGFYQRFETPDGTNRSIAGFADATVPIFTDRFRFRGGLRYTNEHKDELGTTTSGVVGFPPAPLQYNPASETYSKLTWKAGLDFDLTAANLLYATVSTGFKSGGLNNLPAAAGLSTYQPEKITAYEIGSKNRFLNDRLQVNLSAFRYNYKNFQTFEFYQPTGGPLAGTTIFPTVNSQTARFQGGELQLEAALTQVDRLGVSLNVLDNTYTNFVIALPYAPVVNLSDTDVPLSPKKAVTLTYSHVFDLGKVGTLTASADAHYSDPYVVTGNQGVTANGALYTQSSSTKLNANVRWQSNEGGWSVTAFVRNATNRATINTVAGGYPVLDNFLLVNAMVDPPRTYGASIEKDF